MQTPIKFFSFNEQVSLIIEKGIEIKDKDYAKEMLQQIGYFPLIEDINIFSKYQQQINIKQVPPLKK